MDLRDSLAAKLKAARRLAGLSTRAVAAKLGRRFSVSHATIANYENGRSVPPADILACLASLYDRPLNWFLERTKKLEGVQYRNLKSRVRSADLHRFEADVQRWIDAYAAIEASINRPLKVSIKIARIRARAKEPGDLARRVRVEFGLTENEPISSVIDVLEKFGIRVIDNPTNLRIDGLAGRYHDEYVVVLNPAVSNDRARLNAAHELGHVLLGDCDVENPQNKERERVAFDFASQFLLPNCQLKRAFEGQSMVRLVRFKERFGISLAAMVYRAEHLGFITKPTAKALWIEFARRGWRAREPGTVRPDRATRFEQLIEEAISSGRMSIKEVADLAGVRPDTIRQRLSFAVGLHDDNALEKEGADVFRFPG